MESTTRVDAIMSAEKEVSRLVALSERWYREWKSDAAFYVLRAAEAIAITHNQCERIRRLAQARRDEWQHAENEVNEQHP